MDIKSRVLQLLRRAGMTPAEAKFYLTVHQNPHLTMKQLAAQAKLSVSSAYRAFEHLKTLGLVTSSRENWRRSIEAVSLRTVAKKLAKEQRRLRKVELELQSISDLMGLTAFSHMEDPIQIITDQNKITEEAYKELYSPWEHFYCYGSTERLVDIIGDAEEKDWVKKRTKMGKSVDAIITEKGEYFDYYMPSNNKELRNVTVSVDENNNDRCLYIFEKEVTIWHKDKDLGNRAIVISDPTVVKSYQQMFRGLWKSR